MLKKAEPNLSNTVSLLNIKNLGKVNVPKQSIGMIELVILKGKLRDELDTLRGKLKDELVTLKVKLKDELDTFKTLKAKWYKKVRFTIHIYDI